MSLMSWYSRWVLEEALSSGRMSSSCCRCSKAWGGGEGQGGETTNQKQQMVCLGVVFVEASQTFMTTGGSKWYMELDLRCRNFLNSAGEGEEDEP